jgi:hypothetical protein
MSASSYRRRQRSSIHSSKSGNGSQTQSKSRQPSATHMRTQRCHMQVKVAHDRILNLRKKTCNRFVKLVGQASNETEKISDVWARQAVVRDRYQPASMEKILSDHNDAHGTLGDPSGRSCKILRAAHRTSRKGLSAGSRRSHASRTKSPQSAAAPSAKKQTAPPATEKIEHQIDAFNACGLDYKSVNQMKPPTSLGDQLLAALRRNRSEPVLERPESRQSNRRMQLRRPSILMSSATRRPSSLNRRPSMASKHRTSTLTRRQSTTSQHSNISDCSYDPSQHPSAISRSMTPDLYQGVASSGSSGQLNSHTLHTISSPVLETAQPKYVPVKLEDQMRTMAVMARSCGLLPEAADARSTSRLAARRVLSKRRQRMQAVAFRGAEKSALVALKERNDREFRALQKSLREIFRSSKDCNHTESGKQTEESSSQEDHATHHDPESHQVLQPPSSMMANAQKQQTQQGMYKSRHAQASAEIVIQRNPSSSSFSGYVPGQRSSSRNRTHIETVQPVHIRAQP